MFNWFEHQLVPGTYEFRLDVTGSSNDPDNEAVIVRLASGKTDTDGTLICRRTRAQCNNGASFTGTFIVADDTPYLYLLFAPGTKSVFSATFCIRALT